MKGRFDPKDLVIREGESDEGTWHDTFDDDKAYHRPPGFVAPKSILDLGANVGYTAIDLAYLFPLSVIVALEPVPENFDILVRNLEIAEVKNVIPLKAAIGTKSGVAGMTSGAFNSRRLTNGNDTFVYDINTLTAGGVDYVKMDIEGTEKEILKEGGPWIYYVRCIKIELHDDYDPDEALRDLMRLGYDSWRDGTHPNAVIGAK